MAKKRKAEAVDEETAVDNEQVQNEGKEEKPVTKIEAKPKKKKKSRRGKKPRLDEAKVYVGNLDFKVTRHEVRKLFRDYGKINSIDFTLDPQTNEFFGYEVKSS